VLVVHLVVLALLNALVVLLGELVAILALAAVVLIVVLALELALALLLAVVVDDLVVVTLAAEGLLALSRVVVVDLAILALRNAFLILGRVLFSPLAAAALVLVVELASERALAGLLAVVVDYLDVIALT
jgi:hypothetical protein